MAEKKENKKSFGAGIVKYFKDVKGEMKKVVWPTFKQVKNNTIIVIIAIILIGILIWVLDIAFAKTLGKVVEKYGNTETSNSVNFTGEGADGLSLPEGVNVVTDEEAAEEAAEDAEDAAANEEGADAEAETAEDAADAGADSDGE